MGNILQFLLQSLKPIRMKVDDKYIVLSHQNRVDALEITSDGLYVVVTGVKKEWSANPETCEEKVHRIMDFVLRAQRKNVKNWYVWINIEEGTSRLQDLRKMWLPPFQLLDNVYLCSYIEDHGNILYFDFSKNVWIELSVRKGLFDDLKIELLRVYDLRRENESAIIDWDLTFDDNDKLSRESISVIKKFVRFISDTDVYSVNGGKLIIRDPKSHDNVKISYQILQSFDNAANVRLLLLRFPTKSGPEEAIVEITDLNAFISSAGKSSYVTRRYVGEDDD